MLGWAELLKQFASDPQKVNKGLDVIRRSAEAQKRLVDDLLDVSAIVTKKLCVTLAPTALAPVVRAAVDALATTAASKGVALEAKLEAGASVLGDMVRLQQVFVNLLSNAVKFTDRGGRVAVTMADEGGAVVVRISDSGVGIAPSDQRVIFDRFRQVDTGRTRNSGGLGLGLSIVRYLVEAHGGSVDVHSSGLGHGATFTVRLPMHDAAAAKAPSSSTELVDAESPAVPALSDAAVLVVDDDADSREFGAVVLEREGARVMCAGSAAEACERLGAAHYDVLLSDLAMPEEDGVSLIKRVRARKGRAIAAIALTAHTRGEDVDAARAAGFDDVLSKPVEPERLVRAVRQSLALRAG
jgi:CheY-like chemotaxis protein/two-component sensor histidine kinase